MILRNKYLKDWSNIVSSHFSNLSLPEVTGLATWSFGIAVTKSSSLTKISELIAKINQEKINTVRNRLKEWYKEADKKTGEKRSELEVEECFAPLLRWILSIWQWESQEKWLPLAIDTTNIGENFTVLSLNILYEGCGIPVAWKIVKERETGSWRPHWLHLFELLQGVVPEDIQVIVLADRGLYADWLFQAICQLNWHPLLRLKKTGTYRPKGKQKWRDMFTVVEKKGDAWSGEVTCYKSNPIKCTLLASWHEEYEEPWLIMTDLEPNEADISWYHFRAWIESSYRDIKSDGWQWQKTRLQDPKRAERIWLALAVAMIWTVSAGSQTMQEECVREEKQETLSNHNKPVNSNQKLVFQKVKRNTSLFLKGLIGIIADLLRGVGVRVGNLYPVSSYAMNTS
jgi:hypothetical protein